MIEIALNRTVSWDIASSCVRQAGQGDLSHGRRDKSAAVGRAHVVGWANVSRCHATHLTGASHRNTNEISAHNAIALVETFVLPS
jgi:hypothetical protein